MSRVAEWTPVALGEVINLYDSRRVPLSSNERNTRQGKYPYYGASGIIDHIDDYIFDGEYLLVAEDGENLNSRKLPIAFWGKGKFWVNNHAHILLGKEGLANTDFIRHYLLSANISGYITGAAQPKLNQENLKRINIALPKIETQNEIAEVLSTYDNLIENNNHRIAILEEMAQSLYREWFINFRFPGYENTKFIASQLGKIPEGWEQKKLVDIAEPIYGCAFKSRMFNENGSGERVVRIRDIPNNWSNTFTLEKPKKNSQILKSGDLLVGMDGDFHMGKWAGGYAYLNQRVLKMVPKEKYSPYFIFLSIAKPIQELNKSIVGTTVAHLGDKHIKEIQIIVPNEDLLSEVSNIFDPIFKQELKLRTKNQNLKKQRDLLLPKLISGKIEIS